MSAQRDRIERSLKRLGFQLATGRGKGLKITAIGGRPATNATASMTLDQIGNHIKPRRGAKP